MMKRVFLIISIKNKFISIINVKGVLSERYLDFDSPFLTFILFWR